MSLCFAFIFTRLLRVLCVFWAFFLFLNLQPESFFVDEKMEGFQGLECVLTQRKSQAHGHLNTAFKALIDKKNAKKITQ